MTLGPLRRPNLALALPAIAATLLCLAQPAGAQADAPKTDSLERAQKAADAVFHWIKLNGDKGANRQAPAPAAAPAPAPAARKPAPVAAAPKPAPTQNNNPAAAQAVAASPAPAPAPITAAIEVEPEPDRAPVVLASAAPLPSPAAPLATAARAAAPPPVEEAEVPLKLLVKVNPAIPRQLLQAQNFTSGFAQVQFVVAPDGTVGQVQSIKASHTRLAAAAVDAVKQWRFAPIPKAREAAVEVGFSNEGG